jgi:hypothetical protein
LFATACIEGVLDVGIESVDAQAIAVPIAALGERVDRAAEAVLEHDRVGVLQDGDAQHWRARPDAASEVGDQQDG